ncbi:zf-HC2 domain-containing protein [Alteribacillus sp. HJP-4]|uniref:zf-HC2 domain-containing protein n=1 Tax=Alteribacillus sp. HJP-4 TaxID=2775394 RepID=UPI0035CCCD2A
MACDKQCEAQLHKYLDGEMNEQERVRFFTHLDSCPECRIHFDELNKSMMLVQSSSHMEAPAGFTSEVMASLPQKQKRKTWKRWARQHPFLVAASLFVLMMATSLISVWSDQSTDQVSVVGGENVQIDREGGRVIVPEGEVVDGDLTVRNGEVEVRGEITGDLTVINGKPYMASAGNVAGEVEEVDQAVEWVWYHTKRIAVDAFSFGDKSHGDESE